MISNKIFIPYCVCIVTFVISTFARKILIAKSTISKISKSNMVIVPKKNNISIDQNNSKIIHIIYKSSGLNFCYLKHYKIFSDNPNIDIDIYQRIVNRFIRNNSDNLNSAQKIISIILPICKNICLPLFWHYLFAINWITYTIMFIYISKSMADYQDAETIKLTLFDTGCLLIENGLNKYGFNEKIINLLDDNEEDDEEYEYWMKKIGCKDEEQLI
jgi:hypothetical protein